MNAKDYNVKIDLEGILPETEQCQVLFDILDVGVDANIIEDIVKHPVITTMILKKWEKAKWFYFLTTFIYFLFLASYSFLIYDLFGPQAQEIKKDNGHYYNEILCKGAYDKYKDELGNLTACQFRDPICNIGNPDQLLKRSNKLHTEFQESWIAWTTVMGIFVVTLMISELAQFYVLQRLYLKEIENWIEWTVFVSASCTPFIRVN